jgi:hypothetical protein
MILKNKTFVRIILPIFLVGCRVISEVCLDCVGFKS